MFIKMAQNVGSTSTELARDLKAEDIQSDLIRKGWFNTRDFSLLDNKGEVPDMLFNTKNYKISTSDQDGNYKVQLSNGEVKTMNKAQVDELIKFYNSLG